MNIDEQELANFNEALTSVLGNNSALLDRFHSYFSGLGGKVGQGIGSGVGATVKNLFGN
mgnify:CR=1 FL=1